jgi:general L-amino acid transport system substrate-binding protein
MKWLCRLAGAFLLLALTAGCSKGASTLEQVKKKGYVMCGVNTGLPGFSMPDEKGCWTGLDVDLCRAVAAAVLGDADKVRYTPLTAEQRLEVLRSGKIDMLASNTTWTLARDTSMGVHCAGVNYYDGQGFMVKKKLGVRSALELNGTTVCVQQGTTSEANLRDYFLMHRMKYRSVTPKTPKEVVEAYEQGQCHVLTSDQAQLYALRSKLENPEDAKVLPEVISKEPLGPYVREGDDNWFDIVRWSLFVMINAEEMGITSANVDHVRETAEDPRVRRLLGLEDGAGKGLGLDKEWSYRIIKLVGNYGESFDRNLGSHSALKIKRGLNAPWKDGGLLYAPPVR